MKRFSALLLFLSLFILTAWTLEDCVEVNFDHPHCDQYTTTTTGVLPSSTTSTSTPEVSTTSTTGPEQSTTTSTLTQSTTTTTEPSNTPTTTVTIPFDSVPPTTDTTSVISTTHSTNAIPAELPRTGPADIGLAVLAVVSLAGLGWTAVKYGKDPR